MHHLAAKAAARGVADSIHRLRFGVPSGPPNGTPGVGPSISKSVGHGQQTLVASPPRVSPAHSCVPLELPDGGPAASAGDWVTDGVPGAPLTTGEPV